MILPIKHRVDWSLIRQRKQVTINRDNNQKNKHIVEYEYKVRYDVMFTKHTVYKYETPYTGLFVIKWCWNNVIVSLQTVTKEIRYFICCIKPYKYDT